MPIVARGGKNMRDTILESCHGIQGRRPQFTGSSPTRKGDRIIYTATCGCENSTRTSEMGATCDGVTVLCREHAIPDDWDE